MSDWIIRAERLGKSFRISHAPTEPYRALRDVLADRTRALFRPRHERPQSQTEDFWALREVSFEIEPGEVVAVIGRNGAGKSTLLKLLSRITQPSEGRVTLRGRVASLLEVGTGFHPELTGRENIFLNGAILGMSRREIRGKFDEIVAFAEVERFLDTPVKRYSNGMYVRLAFAVAAHLEPEILVVDEVLAVGDAQFQMKCLGKMRDVSRSGRTVLFVSHNMSAVLQLTTRGLLLERGRVRLEGPTPQVVEEYVSRLSGSAAAEFNVEGAPRKWQGSGAARILVLRFERSVPIFNPDEDISFVARIRARDRIPRMRVSMTVSGSDGTPVGSCFTADPIELAAGELADVRVALPRPRLAPGHYFCALAIGKGDHRSGHVDFDVVQDTLQFEVRPQEGEAGTVSAWPRAWGPIVFADLTNDVLHRETPT